MTSKGSSEANGGPNAVVTLTAASILTLGAGVAAWLAFQAAPYCGDRGDVRAAMLTALSAVTGIASAISISATAFFTLKATRNERLREAHAGLVFTILFVGLLVLSVAAMASVLLVPFTDQDWLPAAAASIAGVTVGLTALTVIVIASAYWREIVPGRPARKKA